jgi:hypothetical protein
MALTHKGSRCAICGDPLSSPYTATSGCAFGAGHLLFRYCDAPLHLACLEGWPHREPFSRAYFDDSLASYRSGRGILLHDAGSWFLACGPVVGLDSPSVKIMRRTPGKPVYAEVRLADWPFRLYSPWGDWDAYALDGFSEGLAGAALAVAQRVMSEVRAIAPTQAALTRLLVAKRQPGSPA